MKKEIDPKIQSAATSYAAQFSDGTTLTHFVAFYLGGGDEQAKKTPLFGHRREACGESACLIRKALTFVNRK